ncbi:hypothetical protein FPE50_002490 [Salmonella bongori]|uniref:Uncharacterized protein n=1 Tax=Salmonella bongori TaxID=54736 RepID=A0A698VZP6_SALBN|nr:hypothetical protein [Salmonella bongori]EDP8607120.1 hypothetical protein [Salmonella bongori]EDP8649386.1 hypothetical protein [Salmonella bongori]
MWLFVTHRGEQCNNSICAVAVMENTTRTLFLQPSFPFFLHYLCLSPASYSARSVRIKICWSPMRR